MRKICVVITARTSYTKFKPVLNALSRRGDVRAQVVCAASAVLDRFGRVDRLIESDGFEVVDRIHCLIDSELPLGMAKSTSLLLNDCAAAFSRLKPDIVVVMADRFEILAPSIAASYQNIPLAHIQGGETSGNIDQKVRHAATKLADIHFPATAGAAELLRRLAAHPERIFLTGCPSIDIALEVTHKRQLEINVVEQQLGVGAAIDLSKGYLIVMQHPVTDEYESSRQHAAETLAAIEKSQMPTLWFWPNADAGHEAFSKALRVYRENRHPNNIYFIKNLPPEQFLELAYFSQGVVGNSSVAIRECSFLGVPAVNIGTRQNGRERGPNVLDVNPQRDDIYRAITSHLRGRVEPSTIYGTGQAGRKIAEILSTIDLSFYGKPWPAISEPVAQ
jgi:UDP-hydrolysing UDP-N-acetyl-D-glucosamine 2-epimerase